MTHHTSRISLKNAGFRAALMQLESFDLISHTFQAEINFNKDVLFISAEDIADQKAAEKTIHDLTSFHEEVNAIDDKTINYVVKTNIVADAQKKDSLAMKRQS